MQKREKKREREREREDSSSKEMSDPADAATGGYYGYARSLITKQRAMLEQSVENMAMPTAMIDTLIDDPASYERYGCGRKDGDGLNSLLHMGNKTSDRNPIGCALSKTVTGTRPATRSKQNWQTSTASGYQEHRTIVCLRILLLRRLLRFSKRTRIA